MSKTKTPPSKPNSGSSVVKRPWLRHAFEFSLAVFALAVLPFALVALFGFGTKAIVSHAILYSFGLDGKFSGRMDGNVLMRNGRGRGFTVPSLVRNAYTTAIRSTLALFSISWRSLSGADQLSWNNFKYVKSDRFAKAYEVKGKAAYVALNQNLTDIGQPTISTAPAAVGALEEVVSNPQFAAAASAVKYDATGLDSNSSYLVFATNGLSAGIFRPGKSAFRIIGVQPAPVLGTVDVTTMYVTKFGETVAGTKIFLYTVPVNKTTGEKGFGSAIISSVVV